MLTNERYELILNELNDKQTVKITDLIALTGASESTIRRDLTELEQFNKLYRIHGGATLTERNIQESSISDKSTINLHEKIRLAATAAALVQEGDTVFLDAGTTTFQMIPFLKDKRLTIVTNGLTHIDALIDNGITTYLTGGYVKSRTRALVGPQTIQSLDDYRFDKCFLGVNGFHLTCGYTTPDPEEAAVKKNASRRSGRTIVVADHSKYDKVSFATILELEEAELITEGLATPVVGSLKEKTTVEVVMT